MEPSQLWDLDFNELTKKGLKLFYDQKRKTKVRALEGVHRRERNFLD